MGILVAVSSYNPTAMYSNRTLVLIGKSAPMSQKRSEDELDK